MNTTSALASLNHLGGHNVSSISFSNEEMMSFNLGGDVVELPLPHVATAVALMVGYYMIFVLSIHLIGHARLCMNNFLRAPPAYIVCASFVVVFSLLCNHLPAANASTDIIILSTLFIWLCIFLEIVIVHLIKVNRSLAHDMVVADDNNVVDNAGMPEVVVQYENFNNVGLGWRFSNFNWLITLLGNAIVYYFSNSNNMVEELQSIIRLTKDLNEFWDEVVNYFDTIFVNIGSSVSASHIAVIVFGIPITYYFCNIYKPAAYVNTIMSDDSDYLSTNTENTLHEYSHMTVDDVDDLAAAVPSIDFFSGNVLYITQNIDNAVMIAVPQEEEAPAAQVRGQPASILRRANAAKHLPTLLIDVDGTIHQLPSFNLVNWTIHPDAMDKNQRANECGVIKEAWEQLMVVVGPNPRAPSVLHAHPNDYCYQDNWKAYNELEEIRKLIEIWKPIKPTKFEAGSELHELICKCSAYHRLADIKQLEEKLAELQTDDDDEEAEAEEEEDVEFAADPDMEVVEDEQVELEVQQQEDTVEMKKAKKLERLQKQLTSDLSNYWNVHTSPTRRTSSRKRKQTIFYQP